MVLEQLEELIKAADDMGAHYALNKPDAHSLSRYVSLRDNFSKVLSELTHSEQNASRYNFLRKHYVIMFDKNTRLNGRRKLLEGTSTSLDSAVDKANAKDNRTQG